jgi:phosphatidylglycerophosphatase A
VGLIPFAPGTFGSLVAFPLSYFIMLTSLELDFKIQILTKQFDLTYMEQQVIGIATLEMIVTVILFIFGTLASSVYVRYYKVEDPKEVVIDEVVGQMLVIIGTSLCPIFVQYSSLTNYLSNAMINFLFAFVLPFATFRFFDIVKPWPINWFDKNISGGIGIMLDDVIAAIFAIVISYAITFLFI